jgi:hypothetical protein
VARVRGSSRRVARRQSGFSVLELVIALFIAIEILIAMGLAFDLHNRTARVQLQVADMQQALRIAQWDIARLVRQAGRGGMKLDLEHGAVYANSTTLPRIKGRSIEVRNNVTGPDQKISLTDPDSPEALEGTDILILRGCFSNQVFQVDPDTHVVTGLTSTLEVPPVSVAGVPQAFAGDEIEGAGGTVLMGSYVSSDDWGVATVVGTPTVNVEGNLQLSLNLDTDSPLNPRDEDPALGDPPNNRVFPTEMAVTQVCLLEEYRYYIRDYREAADAITPLRPRLTRARFEPGTETPFQGDSANYSLDLADQIFDLQVALGLDTDYGGDLEDDISVDPNAGTIYEAVADSPAPGRGQDDWLYNDPLDAAVVWCDPYETGCNVEDNPYSHHDTDEAVDLQFLRITTAARTNRPDVEAGGVYVYTAPDFDTRTSGDWLEDHDHDSPPEVALDFNSDANRKFRRRTLTTTVDLRSF